MELLVATNNPGKVKEYQQMLTELLPALTLLTLQDVGIEFEVDETGETFEDNARLKAVAYGQRSGLPTLADDSGLEVAALGGFPGVHSARWSGPTAADRNQQLLARMEQVPWEARGARFVCVTLFRLPDGREAQGVGEVAGRLGWAPRGEGGFGYDPLFVLPDGRTLAELAPHEKHAISHRGRAARAVAPAILEAYRLRG